MDLFLQGLESWIPSGIPSHSTHSRLGPPPFAAPRDTRISGSGFAVRKGNDLMHCNFWFSFFFWCFLNSCHFHTSPSSSNPRFCGAFSRKTLSLLGREELKNPSTC